MVQAALRLVIAELGRHGKRGRACIRPGNCPAMQFVDLGAGDVAL